MHAERRTAAQQGPEAVKSTPTFGAAKEVFQRSCLAQHMFFKLVEFSIVKRPDMTVHKAFFSALMRAAGVPRRLQNRRANMFAQAAETLQRAYVIDLLFRHPEVGPHVGLETARGRRGHGCAVRGDVCLYRVAHVPTPV